MEIISPTNHRKDDYKESWASCKAYSCEELDNISRGVLVSTVIMKAHLTSAKAVYHVTNNKKSTFGSGGHLNEHALAKPRVWMAWRDSKTRLGAFIAAVSSVEVLIPVLVPFWLRPLQVDYLRSVRSSAAWTSWPPSLQPLVTRDDLLDVSILGMQSILLIIMAEGMVSAVCPCPGWDVKSPFGPMRLHQLFYGSVRLHQTQRRSGPMHRRFILAVKIFFFLALGLLIWTWMSMPSVFGTSMREGLDLLRVVATGEIPMSRGRKLITYALLFFDAFSILWAYVAVLVALPFLVMSAALCFAWSPLPDMFTIEELRAMAKAEEASSRMSDEEAVEGEDGEDGQSLITRLVWRVQGRIARLGEDMAAFASRQC